MRTALVTGCSVGLGRATVERLIRENWRVFAGVRKEADAPAGAVPVLLDVLDDQAVATARSRVLDEAGDAGLHALVNNAGLVVNAPVEFMTDADFDISFGVNFRGPLRLIQAFLPQLRSARGRIVNVTSGVTKVSQPFTSLYAASKAALDQLSQVLRLELEPWGIPVILVDPGLMRTRMTTTGDEAAHASMAAWPEAAVQRYRDANLRNVAVISASLSRAKEPKVVASVIARALDAEKPRDHYYVGFDAKAAEAINRLLPWRLRQSLVKRAVFGEASSSGDSPET